MTTQSSAAAAETAAQETVTLILGKITGRFMAVDPETLFPDTNLVHRGLGSLEIMRIVSELRKAGIRADVKELAVNPTLESWTKHLLETYPADEIESRLT
ncbi:phosphopantetheine-binding protein [Streptomyces sp. H34-S4]|uniref:phosphopantetheine-binding protein n=1 Tax=Streptomyces sp. H34-S4 TaxID=2996463 RepID=UPI00227201CE|nr:phosphopantetheine-binding protein [Streptomyces sp. H34-S4]MCY0935127.1 phosphopantetheine-binding protein [Streptomyces sp. H34-S4]